MKLKAEYTSCVCPITIVQSTYQGQTVVEVNSVSAFCDGINVVYRMNGVRWFTSADRTAYENYTNNVQQLTVIWSCTKPKS